MATFVNGAGAKDDANDTSIGVIVTGVQAGDLVWVLTKWEGAATTCSVSDGTSSLTQDALGVITHGNNDLNGVMHYLLASVASGSVTYTATLGAARPFKQIAAGVFRYTGTIARDSANQASGTGDNLNSGNISPTGTELVVLGGWANYITQVTINHAINAVAATATFGNSDGTKGWYRLISSGYTDGAATCDDTAIEWLGFTAAFEVTASGGETPTPGSGSIPFTGYALDMVQAMANDARIVIQKA